MEVLHLLFSGFVQWFQPNSGSSGGSGSGGSAGDRLSSPAQLQGGGVGVSTKGTLLSSGYLYNGRYGGAASLIYTISK